MKRIRTADLRDALPPDIRLIEKPGWQEVLFAAILVIAFVVLTLLFPEGGR
jgi:hypothetical protein